MTLQFANLIPPIGVDSAMMLAIAAVILAGVCAGLLYRAGAVIALSFATLFGTLAIMLFEGEPVWRGAAAAVGLMVVLQVSYLAGAALAVGMQKARVSSSVRATLSALFKRAD